MKTPHKLSDVPIDIHKRHSRDIFWDGFVIGSFVGMVVSAVVILAFYLTFRR
jgi:hypothetical protein